MIRDAAPTDAAALRDLWAGYLAFCATALAPEVTAATRAGMPGRCAMPGAVVPASITAGAPSVMWPFPWPDRAQPQVAVNGRIGRGRHARAGPRPHPGLAVADLDRLMPRGARDRPQRGPEAGHRVDRRQPQSGAA